MRYTFFLWLLPKVALLHPYNWKHRSRSYPQLWWCRIASFSLIKSICGFLTGHEISRTEWGYGGGGFVDRHCRWCDKLIRVPKSEDEVPNPIMEDMAEKLGFYE